VILFIGFFSGTAGWPGMAPLIVAATLGVGGAMRDALDPHSLER
jgi:hypothetical protein